MTLEIFGAGSNLQAIEAQLKKCIIYQGTASFGHLPPPLKDRTQPVANLGSTVWGLDIKQG